MGRLEGRTAVITGGNSGIGLATAKRFVAEGAHVFITGRRQAELDRAVADIGGGVTAVAGDISRLEDLDRLYETVRAQRGRVDVVFANAGGAQVAPLGQITEEQFDQGFGVNVKGTLFTVQKALPLMGPGGSIILTGSTFASMGMPGFSVYGGGKAALRGFVRTWALDLKGSGIRVNVLVPGPISTPTLHDKAGTLEQDGALVHALVAQLPVGRLGQPEEVAAAALFLASDDSRFMTGSELFFDGGQAQI